MEWNQERVLIEGTRATLQGPHRLGVARILRKLAHKRHCEVNIQGAPVELEDQWAREKQTRGQTILDYVLGEEPAVFVWEPASCKRNEHPLQPRRFVCKLTEPVHPEACCWLLIPDDLKSCVKNRLEQLLLNTMDVPPECFHTVPLERFCNTPATPGLIP